VFDDPASVPEPRKDALNSRPRGVDIRTQFVGAGRLRTQRGEDASALWRPDEKLNVPERLLVVSHPIAHCSAASFVSFVVVRAASDSLNRNSSRNGTAGPVAYRSATTTVQ